MCLLLGILSLWMIQLITAEDVTVVGYVRSDTTLICDRQFSNYPGWVGPNGTVLTYQTQELINQMLPISSRLMWASNNRDLIIRDTEKSDAGDYTCSVPGSFSYIIILKVRVRPHPPAIQNAVMSTIRGIEDQTVTITCISRGGYPAPYLDWYRGTTKLTSRRTEAIQGDGTATVTINNSFTAIRNLDKTNYTCQSSYDPPDSPLSAEVMLNLTLKPSTPVITGTTTIPENSHVQLQCRSTGCRPKGNMSWSFDQSITSPNVQNTPVTDTFTISSSFTSRTLYRADNGKSVTCSVGHESLTSPRTTSRNLNVQFGPSTVTLTGNKEIVADGSTLTLTCTVSSSNPVSNISWTQSGQPVVSVDRDNQAAGQYGGKTRIQDITITPTREMDGNAISCTAEHNLLQQGQRPTKQIILDLKYNPVVTIQEGSSITYNEGDTNKILHCTASSKPSSVFKWFNDNKQVKTSNYTVSTNQFDYTISTVSKTHYGVYRCEAENSVGSAGQVSITVKVQFAPSSVSLTGNKQIVANGQNNLTLYCTTDSAYPSANVTWWNGSTQITVGTSQTTTLGDHGGNTTAGKLEIKPTRTMDGDSISCQGSNSQGPRDPPVDMVALNLKYKPITTIVGGSRKNVTEDDTAVTLDCTAESKPPAKFTWYKVGEASPIKTGTGTADHNRLVYTIPKVNRQHAGTYRCTADNEIPSSDSEEQELIVFYPPDITVSTINTTINATDHYINCSADGFPSSYDFTSWTQKWPNTGEIIRDKLKSSSRPSPSTQSLHFPSLTYQDTGVYACGAGNGVKNIVSVGSVFLLVKSSPVVISNETLPEGQVHKVPASLNKGITIHLVVYSNAGDVDTKIYKLSDNTSISINGTSVNNVKTTAKLSMYSHQVYTDDAYALTIYHTIKSQEEFGEFVVYLTNDIGITKQKFEIIPEGPPCKPVNFSVHDPGSDELTVSWIRCFHGGFPQTFVIMYRTDGSEWINGSFVEGGKSINDERLNTSIGGLESNTLYYVKLYAFNERGASNETDVEVVKTTQSGESEEQTSIGPITGGAVGGIVVAVIVIVIVLVIVRRRRGYQGSPKSKLLDENGRNVESVKNDDLPVIDLNPMYVSAGPPSSPSNEIPVYSEVKKPNKNNDIYAEVKKPKSKGANADKKTEKVAETPMKTQKGKQKQKKDKKTKAKKKTTEATNNEGTVYENADELGTVAKGEENVYENRSFTIADEKPSRTKNDDGLIYIEVEVPKKNGKDDRKLVIHGIEDTTDYADIVIGKVGEPAAESDEEESKEKTTD